MKHSYPTTAVLDFIRWVTIAGGLAVVGCDTHLDIDPSPAVPKIVMADTDGDRLSDALEEEIGTDPNAPEDRMLLHNGDLTDG